MLRCPVALREFGTLTKKRASISRFNTFDATLVKFARSGRLKTVRDQHSFATVEPVSVPSTIQEEPVASRAVKVVDASYFHAPTCALADDAAHSTAHSNTVTVSASAAASHSTHSFLSPSFSNTADQH